MNFIEIIPDHKYSAPFDGILIAQAESQDGGRNYVEVFGFDNNGNPITLGRASSNLWTGGNTYVQYGSVSIPFKKGEVFEIVNEQSHAPTSVSGIFKAT